MPNSKILFVDDEEKILNGIERQLGDEFDIVTAVGPQKALQAINDEGPFAVVVSDMRMPDMNGAELLTRLREIHPQSVAMILTGFSELTSTIDAAKRGLVFRFLSKPCKEDELVEALKDGLREFSRQQANEEPLPRGGHNPRGWRSR